MLVHDRRRIRRDLANAFVQRWIGDQDDASVADDVNGKAWVDNRTVRTKEERDYRR